MATRKRGRPLSSGATASSAFAAAAYALYVGSLAKRFRVEANFVFFKLYPSPRRTTSAEAQNSGIVSGYSRVPLSGFRYNLGSQSSVPNNRQADATNQSSDLVHVVEMVDVIN